MQSGEKAEGEPVAQSPVQDEGRYLYCVAHTGVKLSLGQIGIEGNEVYTIPHRDICAVVHNCPAQPYQSHDQERVRTWAIAHQKVVEAAWETWGTVLPLSFDTIIRGETAIGAEQNVNDWLTGEYEALKVRIERVRGKSEYGVQVFWNPQIVAQDLAQTSPELARLEEEIRSKPRGLAYMYTQQLRNLVKSEMESKANQCFKDLYARLREVVDDVRVEKTKKEEDGLQMIMNLSCLVHTDRYTKLGEKLDEIDGMQGFSVRFTGPWPPYSFVGGAS